MPKDNAGNFHFNDQRANAANKMAGPAKAPAPPAPAMDEGATDQPFMTIFEDGMGGYRVQGADGTEESMPDGAALGQYVEQMCGGMDMGDPQEASESNAPDLSGMM
jgi:hypothetical protein